MRWLSANALHLELQLPSLNEMIVTTMFSRLYATPSQLIAAVSFYLLFALNIPFGSALVSAVRPASFTDFAFIGVVLVILLCVHILIFTLFAVPYVLKGVIAVLMLPTASIVYFMHEYGIVIDVNMIRNVFETQQAEVADLITFKLIASLVVFGLLPAALVLAIPVSWPPFRLLFKQNFKRAVVVSIVAVVFIWVFFASFSSFFREQRALLQKLAPANAISSTIRYVNLIYAKPRGPVTAFGTDAHQLAGRGAGGRQPVVIVVVGETARGDRFSLNGYDKPTNPELSKISDLVSFKSVSSCGTDTAQSVPCIFSGLGRVQFSNEKAAGRENLLDIVQHAGGGVHWRENQTGCKGVCDRAPSETLTHLESPAFCKSGECHDEILLSDLKEKILAMNNGGLVVLHMMGSHGPAYHRRVPAAFSVFQPVCETSQFSQCTLEEISNSYDNTIVYSDRVLADLIKLLKSAADEGVDTAMLYASDHGESLGEKGLFLHGMPYSLAPKEQTHVPMVMWLSEPYRKAYGIDAQCLQALADNPYSHDNIFHTALGLLNIETKERDPKLDIVAACHR